MSAPTSTPTATDTPVPTNTPLPTSTPIPLPTATPSPGLEGSLSETILAFQNLGCTLMEPNDPDLPSLDCSDSLGVHTLSLTTSPDLPPDTMQYASLNLTLKESGINNRQLLFEDRHRTLISQYLLSTVPASHESISSWIEAQMDPQSDLSTLGAAGAEINGLYVDISVMSPSLIITIWGRQ